MQTQQVSSPLRRGVAAALSLVVAAWAMPACAATPMITAKGDYACALNSNGSIQCWGDNFHGQLGNGNFTESAAPVAVSGITDAVSVDAGSAYTCAVLSTGTVQCWGYGYHDIAGQGKDKDSAVPGTIASVVGAKAVAVGGSHTCALLDSGTVQCWGNNSLGQLGNDSAIRSDTPVTVVGINNATAIAAGGSHTCALLSSGGVKCWGANSNWPSPTIVGQLGAGSSAILSRTPVPVNTLSTAVSVTAAANHTCATLASGAIQCWGDNFLGQLGDGSATDSNSPVTVTAISNAITVQTGADGTCATLASGSVRCWGSGYRGALGNGSSEYSTIPVAVSNINNATAVDVGSGHACAILSTGTVQCWGDNLYGQLGKPSSSVDYSATPVTVAGLSLGASGLGADADKVFAWAERTLPQYFSPAGAGSASSSGFRLRFYSSTNSYLGVNETGIAHLFYLGPLSANTVVDLGLLAEWLTKAGP